MTSRLDLFQKSSRPTPRSNEPNRHPSETTRSMEEHLLSRSLVDTVSEMDHQIHASYGLSGPDDSPLQLEKVIGCSGDGRDTVLMSPVTDGMLVRSLGSLISIENLDDGSQRCLRGHDMAVTSLAISHSGTYAASGQLGTKHFKGFGAPVFLWHLPTGKRVHALKGLTNKVMNIGFTYDEKYVCATGEDSVMFIWDIVTTEVIYSNRFPSPVTVFHWIYTSSYGASTYEMAYGIGNSVNKAVLSYDPTRVQWTFKPSSFSLTPSINMVRTHMCMQLTFDSNFVLIGSGTGEMLVFRRDTNVFRTSIPICSNGVQCMIVCNNDHTVICGGGDGTIKKVVGNDLSWRVVQEFRLDSSVRSLSLSANQSEFIAACSSGTIYRCLVSNFNNTIHALSHTATLSAISFNYDERYTSNLFVSGSVDGELRVWDIIDYCCVAVTRVPKAGSVNSIKLIQNEFVLSGWEDGFIRCHDITLNRQLWIIANAHRGSVSSVDYYIGSTTQFVVSAGVDCTVRVWKWSTRELITQYTEHKKSISKLAIDIKSPSIIHSISVDGSVLSYDLKATKRIMSHLISGSSLLDFTQRKDSENEIITCDSYGRLLFWDIDYRDPVQSVQDPSRTIIKSCAISPSSRYLAFGGEDQLLKVFDLRTGEVMALGQGHCEPIHIIVWTKDEKQILTSGLDGCLCIWNFFTA